MFEKSRKRKPFTETTYKSDSQTGGGGVVKLLFIIGDMISFFM